MNEQDKKRVDRLMSRVRQRAKLPSCEEVVAQSFERLGIREEHFSPQMVLAEFGSLLSRVSVESLVVLEEHEERCYSEGIPVEITGEHEAEVGAASDLAREQGFRAGFVWLFSRLYPVIYRCFLSVSQSRKMRGGTDLELQIERLFGMARLPFEKHVEKERTDFILPNYQTHESNRNLAMVVSVKRTLRERWRQVAEELFSMRSPNVFLFTGDRKISKGHVESICGRYNIYLVVWDDLKREKFQEESLVLGFTEWATERLSVIRSHWPYPYRA